MASLQIGSFDYEDVSQIRVLADGSLVFTCPDEGVPSNVKLLADEWDEAVLRR